MRHRRPLLRRRKRRGRLPAVLCATRRRCRCCAARVAALPVLLRCALQGCGAAVLLRSPAASCCALRGAAIAAAVPHSRTPLPEKKKLFKKKPSTFLF